MLETLVNTKVLYIYVNGIVLKKFKIGLNIMKIFCKNVTICIKAKNFKYL